MTTLTLMRIFKISWEQPIIFRLLRMNLKRPRSSCRQKDLPSLKSYLSSASRLVLQQVQLTKIRMRTTDLSRIFSEGETIHQPRKLEETHLVTKKHQMDIRALSCTELTSTWMSSPQQIKGSTKIQLMGRTSQLFTTTRLKSRKPVVMENSL